MTASGRILVIEERSCAETNRLWEAVREAGYELVTMPLGRTLEQATSAQRPDVVLLNMIAAEMGAERNRYLDVVSRLSMSGSARRLPVIGVGDTSEQQRPIGMSAVLSRPLSAARLIGRIASLSRLAAMQAELRRRIETGGRFGLEIPSLESGIADGDASVLVVGRGKRYFALETSLSRTATLTGAFTLATARDYLARRSFDLVILDMDIAEATEATAEFRRNPAHFTLPIFAFAEPEQADEIEACYRAGISDLIVGSFDPRELAERAHAAVVESRLREQLKAVYSKARHLASNDALTGLFARGYLMEHMTRLVREARRSGDRFALVGFSVADLADLNRRHGYAGGDAVLRQVGMLIARLVRGEDLAARVGGDRFALLLPLAGYEEALRASERITAVVRMTQFSVADGVGPTTVDLDVGHAVWTASDDAESMLARAFGPQVRS
ncbi:MAG: diguanylate cyclase [Ancalomicrobiaceae bacterium]|nr:diguanylate cyclase [Ancalomicrobiaceae bacterium]